MISKFKISGIHCASCKALIEDACGDIAGIKSCEVDMDGSLAIVEHDDSVDASLIKKEVESLGAYKAEPVV